MPVGRGNAAALLQKVNSQLRGERVPLKTKEEDELATYLSSLTQKTQQARSFNYEDQGDISVSSGADLLKGGGRAASPGSPVKVSAAGSKFLKKKPAVPRDDSDEEGDSEKEGKGGIVIAGGKRDGRDSRPSNKMSALSKASALESKIKGRASGGIPLRRQASAGYSDSDESPRGSEIGVRPGSADTSVGRDGPKFLKNRKVGLEEDSRSNLRSPSPHMFQRSSSVDKKKKKKKEAENKTKGEIVRTLGHVYLTSEEESLAEFIHGLSLSESSVKKPQNLVAKKQQKWRKKAPGAQQGVVRSSPSPINRQSRSPSPFKRSPSPYGKLSRSQSQDSDLMLDSMASEIVEERQHKQRRSRHNSHSSEDHFNFNLMDAASLLPSSSQHKEGKKRPSSAKHNKKSVGRTSASSFKAASHQDKSFKSKKSKGGTELKKADSKSSIFESLGIHMVDELIGGGVDEGSGNSDSEIKTERSDDRVKVTAGRNYSESEIITEIGGGKTKKPVTATPFRAIVAQSVSELIGSGSHPPKKPIESEPDDTDVDNVYSESFASESESKTITMSASRQSEDAKYKERSQSESFDSVSDVSRRGRRRKRGERKLVVEEKTVDVSAADPRGGTHHWNTSQMNVRVSGPYGLQYVDPAPVATHVVSADAMEAMTAYSPNVLALQEMMRAQLDLVRNFVDIQNRIYQSCLDGLTYDHQYTTLEDTKEYIKQNRKPRMTFKEALRLVEQEEGIAT